MPKVKKVKRSTSDAGDSLEALSISEEEKDLRATEKFLDMMSFSWLCCEPCQNLAASRKNISTADIETMYRVQSFLRLLKKIYYYCL